ncbi:MAG TPA: HEPN domain-containing protein [Jatrophihabitans sp.]|nr:HEPN domain-containing protein [Jatrophihabitans sp.]
MAETIIHRGQWWLPDDPDNVQHGVLRIDEHRSATLELVGGFTVEKYGPPAENGMLPVLWNGHIEMIHGRTSTAEVTLLGIDVVKSSGVLDTVADQVLEIDQVMVGALLDDPEEVTFAGVEVAFDYLLVFANRSGLQWFMDFDSEHRLEKARAVAVKVSALNAEWNGYRFRLSVNMSPFQFLENGPDSRGAISQETARLHIEHDDLQSAASYFELVATFQDLLTLAMDHPCAIRSITYRLPYEPHDGRPWPPTVKAYYRYIYPADSKPFMPRDGKQFFTLGDDVRFENIVPRWYELAINQISTALRLILSINYAGDGFVGAELMTQCSALESLHRGLYDHGKMSPEEYEALIAQALAGVDPNWTEMVRQSVRNDLSFAMRLRELVAKPDRAAVVRLLTNDSKWISQAQKGRNALAHATSHRGSMPLELQYRLLMVTRAFSSLVIGQELGIPPDSQMRFVIEGEVNFHARRFGQLMGLLPDGPQPMGVYVGEVKAESTAVQGGLLDSGSSPGKAEV